jgi:aryl-alcohol dehydrogenase-like predicted oxidoreductase
MEKRKLGLSDLELTVIGLGTWAIGGDWEYGWGAQDDADSKATIIEALELGINWIDTAPAYGLGHSEIIIGKTLREWCAAGNSMPIIATKCGLVPAGEGKVNSCIKRQSIINECEDSLKRLQIDCIDLYQIHWPEPAGDIGEAFQTLLELKKQGKIRFAGVSNFSAAQMQHVSQYGVITSNQPPYSMINRSIEEKIIPWCIQNSVGTIAYSPLQCGLLTGKVTRDWINQLPKEDWRTHHSEFFKEPKLSKLLSFIEEVRNLPVSLNHSLTEISIQWILNAKGVTSAICGARKAGQITQIVKALEWQMTSDERISIDNLYHEILA